MSEELFCDTFVRHVDVLSKNAADDVALQIHQATVGDVGCVVWDAALALAYYLQTTAARKKYIYNKNIIELGSGTGIVGLVAATCGAKSVVITDLPQLLPLMKKNIDENKSLLKAFKCHLKPGIYRWGNHDDLKVIQNELSHAQNFQCVLIADCVYYEEAVDPLASTIHHIIATSSVETIAICSFEERDIGNKKILQENFKHALVNKYALNIDHVPYSEMHEDYRSHDIHIFCISKNRIIKTDEH